MVVSKITQIFIGGALFISVGIQCQADPTKDISTIELRSHVERKVASATADYGAKVEQCSAAAASADLISLADLDKKLNLNREQLIAAIGHLSFRNLSTCSRNEKRDLFYLIGQLEKLDKITQGTNASSFSIADNLDLFPTKKEFELDLKYNQIPEGDRQALEDLFSDKPFDLVKTLEENNLMR
jgi:hypothetical protein